MLSRLGCGVGMAWRNRHIAPWPRASATRPAHGAAPRCVPRGRALAVLRGPRAGMPVRSTNYVYGMNSVETTRRNYLYEYDIGWVPRGL